MPLPAPIHARLTGLRALYAKSKETWNAPPVRLTISGDAEALSLYRYFTRPHPRFRIVQAKKFGVALLPLPATIDDYVAGSSKKYLRQVLRKGQDRGLTFRAFDSLVYADAILALNLSADERQGRPIDEEYATAENVRQFCAKHPTIYGVFTPEDQLVAYAHVPVVGEVAVLDTLFGHADWLKDGVMYILITEILKVLIAYRATHDGPDWLMYDTYWGAKPGLRFFKERMGFEQFTVTWKWKAATKVLTPA